MAMLRRAGIKPRRITTRQGKGRAPHEALDRNGALRCPWRSLLWLGRARSALPGGFMTNRLKARVLTTALTAALTLAGSAALADVAGSPPTSSSTGGAGGTGGTATGGA